MRVCAVIPAYNEAAHVGDVARRAAAFTDAVLVVDDGSGDETAAAARDAGAETIIHSPNAGKGRSLRDGLDYARDNGFDAVVALDADGQHAPEEIPRFIDACEAGAHLVVGNRMADLRDMPLVRRFTNRTMSWTVSRLAGTDIPDTQNGFRLLTTDAWEALSPQLRTTGFDFESDMLVQAGRMGMRVDSVPISTIYADEVSAIHPVRDAFRFFSLVARKLVESRPPPFEADRASTSAGDGE